MQLKLSIKSQHMIHNL